MRYKVRITIEIDVQFSLPMRVAVEYIILKTEAIDNIDILGLTSKSILTEAQKTVKYRFAYFRNH